MTATADLLDFAAAEHRLPPATRAATLRLLGDTLAVGAAGATAPGAAGVLSAARGWGAGDDACLLGHRGTLPAPSAAFVNGFNIHCLEWDAVHEGAVVHALSVVTAAVAAACHRRGSVDPEEALTAIAVGVDIAAGLGIAAESPLTFFRPATAGTIGAALAVARIDGVGAVADVLGLAHAACAGTMQAHVEGSIALPLQVANAARAAVAAVDLVKAGLTGPHDALAGPFGYFALFDRGDLSTYTAGLGTRWLIDEVSTKSWPSGRASHGVLGALAALRPEIGGLVAAIEARVPSLVIRLVGRPPLAEMTPAYARLCLPVLAALMLRDGRIDPRAFTDLPPPAPLTLIDDGNPDPNALSPQYVMVTLADGTRLERAVPATPGSPGVDFDATAKLALARELAPHADPRIYDAPLDWLTAA
ncbi:MmgE/PrpD family protein [Glacieibacterium frigidum]|uniref:MmgE/PrpD family protein n=1 Tax=Glacieibacterium frigidum TaxID=2593303 RepID=A0A552UIH9_9SPHN|nr:MmgE/PrpD family protein [Glacieibacterium frigidum]TRW18036.1 MmgE/PrpD family protein [Glacieibacterium frigidum]